MLAEAFARKALSTYDVFRDILPPKSSASGKAITKTTALEVAAVFACLRVRANGVAQVPLKIMRESGDGRTRLPAKEHPLYALLSTSPNGWQTSFEYLETLSLHLDLCGQHYSFINRSSRGDVLELITLEPGSVTVDRADDYTLTYQVRAQNGGVRPFPASTIWHVRGPSWNSWMGLECVQLAREAIGLSMALEEQQARMQKNGVRASGTYSIEGSLKSDQFAALKKWVMENNSGAEIGAPLILDRGAKWFQNSLSGVDAETLDTRRYQVEEICRHFQVNPIMIFAESKNTTYASAEQMFLAHVVHTLAPTYRRIEQSIDANLLRADERKAGLYANFVDAGLLRGSITTQKDVILGYVNGGVMKTNEGRALLDMNPDDDPASDKLRVPANIVGSVKPAESEPADGEEDRQEWSVTPLKAMPSIASIPLMAGAFYFLRHAESSALDTLTETGAEQAAAAAQKLGGAGVTAIYSSNLGRARDTAEAIGRALGVQVTVIAGLAERQFAEPWASFSDRTGQALAQIPAEGLPLIVAHAGTYRWLSALVGNASSAESVTNGVPILFSPKAGVQA
jgi:HK97 family phage portal protein